LRHYAKLDCNIKPSPLLKQLLQAKTFKYLINRLLSVVWIGAFLCYSATRSSLWAQSTAVQTKIINIKWSECDGTSFVKNRNVKDSLDAVAFLHELCLQWHRKGFISAGVDSVVFQKDTIYAWLYKGIRYKIVAEKKSVGTKSEKWNAQFTAGIYGQVPQVLTKLENSGYPFATLHFDSIKFSAEKISFQPVINPGPYILFDTLARLGNVAMSHRFIKAYTRIVPGNPYSARVVSNLKLRLQALPFLQVDDDLQVKFTGNRATPLVKLSTLKSNQFNGIIGFLPNDVEGGKLLLTGQVNLLVNNLFKAGKTLSLDWQSFRPRSQRLDIFYNDPALLGSFIEFKPSFKLFKEDSLFLNRQFKSEWSYFDVDNGHFGVVSQIFRSRSSAATGGLAQLTANQTNADVNLNSFGFLYAKLWGADPLILRRGAAFKAELTAGNKSVLNRPEHNGILLNIPSRSAQYNLNVEFTLSGKIFRQWHYQYKNQTAGIFNDYLFINELHRIGGLKTIRGFNENHFFADRYLINSAELRYFIEQNTFLYGFVDQAFVSSNTLIARSQDFPLGLGAGLSFKTAAGQLNVVYALGKERNNPMSINTSKIHFGFIGMF
jgi:hypothetical protein